MFRSFQTGCEAVDVCSPVVLYRPTCEAAVGCQVVPLGPRHQPCCNTQLGLTLLLLLPWLMPLPSPPLSCVQASKEVLRDGVLPSLTDASVQHAFASTTLDTALLGFETGGEGPLYVLGGGV